MCCVSEHDVLSTFYTKVNIYVRGLDLRNAIKLSLLCSELVFNISVLAFQPTIMFLNWLAQKEKNTTQRAFLRK